MSSPQGPKCTAQIKDVTNIWSDKIQKITFAGKEYDWLDCTVQRKGNPKKYIHWFLSVYIHKQMENVNVNVHEGASIHGRHPLHLVEKIVRERIQESLYWKEKCYGLNSATLMDRAVELDSIGGLYGHHQPTEFLCLILKMLQLLPEKEIVVELIKQEDFKYVRALGAFYLRLTGKSKEIYQYLEPLLNDYRKLRVHGQGGYQLSHMDSFVDELLHEPRVCDIILPRIMSRHILEENDELEPRESALEDDLD